MDFLEQYVQNYSENYPFRYIESMSLKILDVSIGLDIFEYENKYNHRERAHVSSKRVVFCMDAYFAMNTIMKTASFLSF